MKLFEQAQKAYKAGVVAMPLKANKAPLTPKWGQLKAEMPTKQTIESLAWNNAAGIGYICGKVSGNLFCFDIDQKNDPNKTIATEFKQRLTQFDREWMGQFVIETSVNGGYHLIARCEQPIKTEDLANHQGESGSEVILETRGEGSYFAGFPTPGYKLLHGSFDNIPVFSADEVEMMLILARELDRAPPTPKPAPPDFSQLSGKTGELPPGADYNNNTTLDEFYHQIIADGWREVGRSGQKVYLIRPGKSGREHSATFNSPETPGKLYVFSSSANLPQRHGMDPFAYLTHKEYNGNFSDCAKALAEKGFGEQTKLARVEKKKNSLPEGVGFKFLSDLIPEHEQFARKHKGVLTGFEFIDQVTGGLHEELMVLIAEPGAYKTTMLVNLLDRVSERYDGLAGFFSMEMSQNATMKRINHMITGFPADAYYKRVRSNAPEWVAAKKRLIDNRRLMVCDKSRLSVPDMIEIIKRTETRVGKRFGMIGIDYLDFISSDERTYMEKIDRITTSLKSDICNRFHIPVVLLCQTKRGSNREGVDMRDARGGTSIEGSGDFVLGLYKSGGELFCEWLKHRDVMNAKYTYSTGQINLGDGSQHFKMQSIVLCDDFTKGIKVGNNEMQTLPKRTI